MVLTVWKRGHPGAGQTQARSLSGHRPIQVLYHHVVLWDTLGPGAELGGDQAMLHSASGLVVPRPYWEILDSEQGDPHVLPESKNARRGS